MPIIALHHIWSGPGQTGMVSMAAKVRYAPLMVGNHAVKQHNMATPTRAFAPPRSRTSVYS
jgi:hypothetical protein